jgi:hypothetical protein
MSQFTYAGVSKHKGEFKVRFANDQMRVKVLAKNDHTDIDIIALPDAMTKEAAVVYLTQIAFWDKAGVVNAEVRAAIEAEQTKREPKAASKDKPKKEAKKPKKEVPAKAITLDAIKAKAPKVAKPNLEDLEEAPF